MFFNLCNFAALAGAAAVLLLGGQPGLDICVHMYVCMYVYECTYIHIHMSIYLSLSLSIYIYF